MRAIVLRSFWPGLQFGPRPRCRGWHCRPRMLWLGIGHRPRLEYRPAAKPARQPVQQHPHLRSRCLRRLAEERPLPALGRSRRHHLHRDPLDLSRHPHPCHPQPHEFHQMLCRTARLKHADIDDRRRTGLAEFGRLRSLQPHLQRHHSLAVRCQRRDTLLQKPLSHCDQIIQRRVTEQNRKIEGLRGGRKFAGAGDHQRLGPLAGELRQPLRHLWGKPRREALPRQTGDTTNGLDAHISQLCQHGGVESQGRSRQSGQRLQLRPWRHDRPTPMPPTVDQRMPVAISTIVTEGIRMVHGSPGGGRGIGNRGPRMNTPRGQRPDDRADERPLATEKSGRASHVDLQTLRPHRLMPRRLLNCHDRRKPPAIAGKLLERSQVGHGIVMLDLGNMTGTRAVRERQHRHRFGKRHARQNRRDRRSPRLRPRLRPQLRHRWSRSSRRRRPGPGHHLHHAAAFAPTDKHGPPAQLRPLKQPPLHGPPWQPDRHDARHATPSGWKRPF